MFLFDFKDCSGALEVFEELSQFLEIIEINLAVHINTITQVEELSTDFFQDFEFIVPKCQ